MSLASTQHPLNTSLPTTTNVVESKNTPDETEANLSTLLGAYTNGQKHTSMERGSTAYTQSDNTSAAQYPPHQEVRSSNYPAAATTASEYSAAYPPSSARPGNFSDHLQRTYHSSSHSTGSGGMAQPTNPSIAASSPTYASHPGQHSPYPPQDTLQYSYSSQHTGGAMYTQPRPDWAGYAGHPPHASHHQSSHNGMNYPVTGAPSQSSVTAVGRGQNQGRQQVYSFVPIPGSTQQKRPRRRFEEIERMYKCGHQGCEKAYGTLNHLNAHVTMQSHGSKRTPEEFKEIRKEWKARKKEEELQRKEAEAARAGGASTVAESHSEGAPAQGAYAPGRNVQLPPIGAPINYQPGAQVPNQYQQPQAPASSVQQLQGYNNGQANIDHYGGYPASPYGSSNHIYSHQSNPAQPKYEH